MRTKKRIVATRRLRVTFALAVAGSAVLIMALSGYVVLGRQRAELMETARARSEIVLDLVVGLATPALLTFDFYSLDPYIGKLQDNPDVVYVAIRDREGKVVRETKRKPAGSVLEITRPIATTGKQLGEVRLSLSLDAVDRSLRKTTLTVVLQALVAVLLLSGGMYASFAVLVATPLSRLDAVTKRIAAGDLTERVPVDRDDEIGALARTFNSFLDKLHEIIAQIVASASRVAAASEELATSSRQTAHGAEEQTRKAGQVANAMQEMSATVSEVSQNAEEVTRASRDATGVASKGQTIVSETVEGMRAIAERVKESAQVIGELGQRSLQIGSIVDVIGDVADQTNLLALNAAIEAARAGEQGRGFAVVADEVRKLAERTARATKEISDMIRTIQDRTAVVVAQMTDRKQEVEAGLERAHRAGDSLGEIVQVVEQVMGRAEQIASATQQQFAATGEVSSNVEDVATIARQAAVGAAETAQATEELARLAQEMQRALGRFTLRHDNSAPTAFSR
jgi:methyl-accepting chemotaxis protein